MTAAVQPPGQVAGGAPAAGGAVVPPVRDRRGRRGPSGFRRALRRHWQLYLLAAVPLVWYAIFQYIPMANAVIAFKDYNPFQGIWGSPWVGLEHFERFVSNPIFGDLVRNTLLLSVYGLLAGFPIPVILALALNEVGNGAFRRAVQMVTYAPYFISTVVIVSMVMLFLNPRVGLISGVLQALGFPDVDLMGQADAFRHIYVWSGVWQTAGYSAVIYMAALAGVDQALYDAAKVDGANRLQKIWHVDIPGIMPTMAIVLVLSVGNIMAIGFEKVFLLQNPLNLGVSEIIPTYVYKVGLLNADFSYATAVGLFNAVINLVLLLVVNKVVKKLTGSGLW